MTKGLALHKRFIAVKGNVVNDSSASFIKWRLPLISLLVLLTILVLSFAGAAADPTLEVGKFYKIDVSFKKVSDLSLDSDAKGFYGSKAVIEVKNSGYVLHFFQTTGFEYIPAVPGYKFDSTQNDNNTSAEAALFAADRESNSNNSTDKIAVDWNDINRSLLVNMGVIHGSGNPVPTSMRLVIDKATAQEMTDLTYLGFTFIESGEPKPVNKTSLQAKVDSSKSLKAADYTDPSFAAFANALKKAQDVLDDENATQAEVNDALSNLTIAVNNLIPLSKRYLEGLVKAASLLKDTNFTTDSFAALTKALNTARAIVENKTATQAQVSSAYDALETVIENLVPASIGGLKVGKFYLMSVSARNAGLTGVSDANKYYDTKAVVEVQSSGYVVYFFQTDGFQWIPAKPGYRYDSTQNDNNIGAGTALVAATRAKNAAKTADSIKVKWPDIKRSLLVNVGVIRGSGSPVPTDMRMVLNSTTATEMIDLSYLGFTFVHTPDTGVTVNKTGLKSLISKAAKIRKADYTKGSYAVVAAALVKARQVRDNAGATQAQVNSASTRLKTAMDSLVLKNSEDASSDGRYTVRVDFWHQYNNTQSMANASLNHTAVVDIDNGRITMSISTRPIKIGDTTVALRALTINGTAATVISRNIAIKKYGVQPSAYKFSLPNKDAYQSAVFYLTPGDGVPPSPPGRLRIDWSTLKKNSNAGLSNQTSPADATKEDLEKVKRSSLETTEAAVRPVIGDGDANNARNGNNGTSNSEADSEIQGIIEKLRDIPWYGLVAILLGLIGAVFGVAAFGVQVSRSKKLAAASKRAEAEVADSDDESNMMDNKTESSEGNNDE